MNKFMKLVPVALGLLTLASCSDDSFISEKNQQGSVTLEKGEMLVNFAEPQEDGSAFTRGYTSRDMQQRRWWSGVDRLMVYGSQFGAFDTYEFLQGVGEASGKFKIVSSPSYVSEAKWAIFPYENVSEGKWEQTGGLYNSTSSVKIKLPKVITYDAAMDANNTDDTQPYYIDNLPRFGEVSSLNNGDYLSTNLNWLTGILRLQLAGTPTYANGIKVQLQEGGVEAKTLAINGNPTVVIAHNDKMIAEGAQISASDIRAGGYAKKPNVDGSLFVYIPDKSVVDKNKSVIFLPLPVWNKEVDIVIYTAADYDGNDAGTATWDEYARLKNKTITVGKVYGNKTEYNLAIDGTNPEAISDALEMIETDKETITLVATNPIEVCAKDNFTTIEIPNKEGVKNIIIDVRKGLNGCGTDPETLNIVYKNSNDKFTGNVTLITPTTDKSNPVKLNVDLDKSGFAIVHGKGLNQSSYGTIDIDAREFVIGNEDPYTPTPGFAANYVKFSKNVKTFVVAKEASINSFGIDQVTDPNEDNWVHGGVNKVVVNGTVGGNIDVKNSVKPGYEVEVIIQGEKATVAKDKYIATNGTVSINAGAGTQVDVAQNITAGKAITATGNVKIYGDIESLNETVTLSGKVEAATTGYVNAKGNISISEKAKVAKGAITSKEGDITINNAFNATATYGGAIEAKKGSISLNQVNADPSITSTFEGGITAAVDVLATGNVVINTKPIVAGQDVTLSGKATVEGVLTDAGRDFTVTEEASTTSGVHLKRTATVNVNKNGGDAIAVAGIMTFADGADYALKLLNGYVNSVNNSAGQVALTFSDSPAFAAIKEVAEADNLLPTNKSIWNGKQPADAAKTYMTEGEHIWTATQLGYQLKTPTKKIQLRSNIDLNNEEWKGIDALEATTFTGKIDASKADAYWHTKTISNLNLVNPENRYSAGFYATAKEDLTVENITFDGVKTTFDIVALKAGTHMDGVGTVVGSGNKVELSRVSAKLAGGKFGSDGTENKQSANIGGLIGKTQAGVTLSGVQVDATGAALSGWYSLGGFIGKAAGTVTIQLAIADGKMKPVKTSTKGVAMNITYVDKTKVNDLYQGMTGLLVGSLGSNLTITDYDGDVKAEFTRTGADEARAFKITGEDTRHFFGRADQTLVGHNGDYLDNDKVYTINGVVYQIYKEGGVNYSPGNKHFYDLTKEPHEK